MHKTIYLDNAATSHPKPEEVYRAVAETLIRGGSAGRGSHSLTQQSDRLVFQTRELLADIFNVPASERFIFTSNATSAINLALFGLLRPGDRVVTTSTEHNAIIRPLRALEREGVEVVKVAVDPVDGIVSAERLKQACLEKPTRLLVMTHCSNVSGALQPVEQLGAWCRAKGIVFMLDAAQSAGAVPIDVESLAVDLFAAPGHKNLLGPQGTGFLYVGEGVDLRPLIFGGTGTNSRSDEQPSLLPERLESGTLNLPGLAGLNAGLVYLRQRGLDDIRYKNVKLIEYLLNGLQQIDDMIVYGPDDIARRGDVVSFNVRGRDPSEIVDFLARSKNIAVRGGLHCAPDAHRSLGTFPQGTVRVSPGCLTRADEIDDFLQAMKDYVRR